MLGKIFIPYHTQRRSRKKVHRLSSSYDQATTIGVVCSYGSLIEQDNQIDEFVENLKNESKKVSLLVFHENSSNTSGISNNSFSKRDLNFFGFWNNEKVKVFLEKEFDFLINLDLEYNMFIGNIMASSKARCRIGVYNEEAENSLELMIKPDVFTVDGLIAGTMNMLKRIRDDE